MPGLYYSNSSAEKTPPWRGRHTALVLAALAVPLATQSACDVLGQDNPPASVAVDPQPRYSTQALSGRVVWMADAMQQRFGVRTDPDARQRILALQTPAGRFYPLLEDTRGQSFRKDERLRQMDVELLVRIYDGAPLAQVVRIYVVKKDGKFLLDYWCDICAIAMYELGPCDCCQGPIRLRERTVDDATD